MKASSPFRDYLRNEYGGSNRGETLFSEFPIDVHALQASNPDMVHPKMIHDFVQEMVCATYRLPAAVVQYGVGLEQTTENATLKQYEKQAWETGLIPVGNQVASQMGRQLLPAYGLDFRRHRLALDYSGVEALQESEDSRAERVTKQFTSGLITRAQGLEALGWPVKDTDHVRHIGVNMVEIPDGVSQLDAEEQLADQDARMTFDDDDDNDDE